MSRKCSKPPFSSCHSMAAIVGSSSRFVFLGHLCPMSMIVQVVRYFTLPSGTRQWFDSFYFQHFFYNQLWQGTAILVFVVYLFDGFCLCNIFISAEKKKKTISTRLTKENPKQRPSIPPMFAIRVATDITCVTISEKWKWKWATKNYFS